MTPDISKQILFQMKRIRYVEEEIARCYPEGKMRCPTHLSIGQEAVAAAVGLALETKDMAVSGHRAHAHYLGKGGNLKGMIAEIYGKATGCSRGKGGSMHLIDETVGFMGSTAIVGGTVPVGVGLAFGMKVKKSDQVSCVFHGDAAVETGAFFESVNFAVIKKLPVLFVCENNLYSVYSPLKVRQPESRSISSMAAGLGMHTISGDGNDASEVYRKIRGSIEEIRFGRGPMFFEFSTYRWLEHCGPFYDNHIGYRSETEFLKWQAKDPIARFEREMLKNSTITKKELKSMDHIIAKEVEEAFIFALESPYPSIDSAFTDLYFEQSNVHFST